MEEQQERVIPEPAAAGLLDATLALVSELRALAHDHLRLATLEVKHACESLVWMIAAGVVAAILVVTAWLGLSAAAVLALSRWDVPPDLGILIVAGLNLAGVAACCLIIRRKSNALYFSGTVRSLKQAKAVLRSTVAAES